VLKSKQLVLVLDNCEHLVDDVAKVVAVILSNLGMYSSRYPSSCWRTSLPRKAMSTDRRASPGTSMRALRA
jgi:hypothetical protein